MADVSQVSEKAVIERYDPSTTTENKAAAIPAEVTAPAGESEHVLKEQEALHRALSPNLIALDQEQKIQTQLKLSQHAFEKFPLLKELFKIKLQTLKQTGVPIDKFVEEAQIIVSNSTAAFWWVTPHRALKLELIELYSKLLNTAKQMGHETFLFSYTSPYLQLFELEKETGFAPLKIGLLALQIKAYLKTMKRHLSEELDYNVDLYDAKPFYALVILPEAQKILPYLEQEDQKELISVVLAVCFLPIFSRDFKEVDPLASFFPYLVHYSSLDTIQDYFDQRYRSLDSWDRNYRWIDLHCRAAELLAPTDPAKAKSYLEKAEKEVTNRLWAYSFSLFKDDIEKTRHQALARIANAKAKTQQPHHQTLMQT